MSRAVHNSITQTKAPSLPAPAVEYSQTTQEISNNTARAYFNQLDQANADTITQINTLNTLNWLGTGSF